MRQGPLAGLRFALGSRIAPPRFVLFVAMLFAAMLASRFALHNSLAHAFMQGFDLAGAVFIVSLYPLAGDHGAVQMRCHAAENGANRNLVLGITGIVSVAILAAIAAELGPAHKGDVRAIVELIFTLALAWGFINCVFMLHYAHACYEPAPWGVGDHGGFEFPGTPEPDYWDFLYFSFTAGMSFAASDVNVTRGGVRRIVVLQCLLSFIFNIGVLAFSINVLAGAAG